MKMNSANVEFVTFEAQDVIATSLYLTGAFLKGAAKTGSVGFEGGYSRIATISGKSFADGIYKVSPVYSVSTSETGTKYFDVTLTKTDFTLPSEVAECWEVAGGANGSTGVLNLLKWLRSNGTEQ